jgi:hypothetical protein
VKAESSTAIPTGYVLILGLIHSIGGAKSLTPVER